jgi:hypothetical protein
MGCPKIPADLKYGQWLVPRLPDKGCLSVPRQAAFWSMLFQCRLSDMTDIVLNHFSTLVTSYCDLFETWMVYNSHWFTIFSIANHISSYRSLQSIPFQTSHQQYQRYLTAVWNDSDCWMWWSALFDCRLNQCLYQAHPASLPTEIWNINDK